MSVKKTKKKKPEPLLDTGCASVFAAALIMMSGAWMLHGYKAATPSTALVWAPLGYLGVAVVVLLLTRVTEVQVSKEGLALKSAPEVTFEDGITMTMDPPPKESHNADRPRRILWVNDIPESVEAYKKIFEDELKLEVTVATSTEAAKKIVKEKGADYFGLVISDVGRVEDGKMNPSAGFEFWDWVSKESKKLEIVFCTNHKGAVRVYTRYPKNDRILHAMSAGIPFNLAVAYIFNPPKEA